MTASMAIDLKNTIFQAVHQSRLPRLLPRSFAGAGVIVALHRVRPERRSAFEPNRSLEITPEFLDQTIQRVRAFGFDIVSLDEMLERLQSGSTSKRFLCFTLDDGYADNYHHAAPVFEAHRAPFSIYATTGFIDRTAIFWWMILEEVIGRNTSISLEIEGTTEQRSTVSIEDKYKAFNDFHQMFRALPAEACLAASKQLCDRYAIDPGQYCAEHSMTWDMARKITDRGLGTIEAHTETHLALSRQAADDIPAEIKRCCSRIVEETGRMPKHFAYPFGDPMAADEREFAILQSLPMATAVTTRTGMLWPKCAAALSALPRLPLNGYYQSLGYVDLLLSGMLSPVSRLLTRS